MLPGELMRKISETLQTIDVRGKDNLERLLGCIQLLDSLAEQMDKLQEKLDKINNGNGKEKPDAQHNGE